MGKLHINWNYNILVVILLFQLIRTILLFFFTIQTSTTKPFSLSIPANRRPHVNQAQTTRNLLLLCLSSCLQERKPKENSVTFCSSALLNSMCESFVAKRNTMVSLRILFNKKTKSLLLVLHFGQ